jgi:hypothetical protein
MFLLALFVSDLMCSSRRAVVASESLPPACGEIPRSPAVYDVSAEAARLSVGTQVSACIDLVAFPTYWCLDVRSSPRPPCLCRCRSRDR